MKVVFLKYLLLALLFLAISQNLFAQKTDCLIYERILIHLNEEWSNIEYADTGFVNPETPEFHKVKLEGKRALNFFIVQNKSEFRTNGIKGWFSKLMNSTAIVIDGYTTPDNDSIVNCQFATKSVKYQFVEYKMVSSFSEQDYTTAGKGKSIIHYAPARVVFSNILYHANQTALVYTMVKIGSDGGGGVMYGFVFEREKDNWVLKKVGNESR